MKKSTAKTSPIGRRPSGGRALFFWSALAASVIAAVGVAHTWTRVAVLERKYQLAHDRSEHERLVEQLDKLSLEAATLASAAKVDDAAHGALKMTKPVLTGVVVVDAEVPAVIPKAQLANNER